MKVQNIDTSPIFRLRILFSIVIAPTTIQQINCTELSRFINRLPCKVGLSLINIIVIIDSTISKPLPRPAPNESSLPTFIHTHSDSRMPHCLLISSENNDVKLFTVLVSKALLAFPFRHY